MHPVHEFNEHFLFKHHINSLGQISVARESTHQNDRTERYSEFKNELNVLCSRHTAAESDRSTFANISGLVSGKLFHHRLFPDINHRQNRPPGNLLARYDIIDGHSFEHNIRSRFGGNSTPANMR